MAGELRLLLQPHPADTRLSWRRRQVLSGAGIATPEAALEIGAFDNPTLRADDGLVVRYADYFSAEELRRKHAGNPHRDPSRIVEVDHVIKGPRLSPFVREQMGLVVANHVIEHIADPIGWLVDLALCCRRGAVLFMAVPDQRFTFDYHKQPSDITDLVRAHEAGQLAPDAYNVARMRHLHMRVDAAALWEGAAPPARPSATHRTYRQILEAAREEVAEGYTDVHCTFYTSASFVHVFTELARSDYIPWRARLLHDVDRGGNEFYVALTLNG